MRPLNLASRPFRNEKLPKFGLAVASLLILLLSLYHVRTAFRLLPRNTSKLAEEVRGLEEQQQALRADASRLRTTKPNPADAARWVILKELVDRKVFSWTRLFAVLEESLPMGVRLVSVQPAVQKGQFLLELDAVAQSVEDGLEMIGALEARPEFENVRPVRRLLNDQGVMFSYSMSYNPPPLPSPTPAPSASPSATPAETPPPGAASGEQP
jgi:Tfp pilus assembly protein PilN